MFWRLIQRRLLPLTCFSDETLKRLRLFGPSTFLHFNFFGLLLVFVLRYNYLGIPRQSDPKKTGVDTFPLLNTSHITFRMLSLFWNIFICTYVSTFVCVYSTTLGFCS